MSEILSLAVYYYGYFHAHNSSMNKETMKTEYLLHMHDPCIFSGI